MEANFDSIARGMKLCTKSDTERAKEIDRLVETIKRKCREAISLEASYFAEVNAGDVLALRGSTKLEALSRCRSKTLHEERCRAIKQVAALARTILLDAMGTLSIDETTACTGLDEIDRRTVSEVSGGVSRW